jgi:Fucose-binding lectin II (PA-IIL)
MSDWVTIPLPPQTTVVVQCYANAAYTQRITITPHGQDPLVYQGTGFYDTPIGSGEIYVSQDQEGYATVVIENSQDGGQTWSPSEVDVNDCEVSFYNLIVVASEDSSDNTWDDATAYFSYTSAGPE